MNGLATPVDESLFRCFRATADAAAVEVKEQGGRYGHGVLEGVSLISRGEALGHDMWIDSETLSQVVDGFDNEKGLKSRFTHPSMSSDGMGRMLGRIHDVRLSGDKVIGDLHFNESSHSTPEGDLAEYVMLLASEDAEAAGLSIVFEHDPEAETEFINTHSMTEGVFESPDELNTANYPHVRLAKLRAADVVDEPAANPDGFFDRQPFARSADDLLSFAAGLTETKPGTNAFGVDPGRAKDFFARWLHTNGLSIVSKEELAAMAKDNNDQTPEAESVTP